MITTFERLAKVIKGEAAPANWVERAFASIAGTLVPSYTAEDNDKVLTVKNNALSWEESGGSGIGAVELIVDEIAGTVKSSKTWQELKDSKCTAFYNQSNLGIMFHPIFNIITEEGVYKVEAGQMNVNEEQVTYTVFLFNCDSANDYPTLTM